MTLSYLWTGILFFSVTFACLSGNSQNLSSAAIEGASSAVELCLSMTGTICLWSGLMEVMRQSGLAEKLANLLKPLLIRLFPEAQHDKKLLSDISANVSANLLGLGNAATPLGLQATKSLSNNTKEGVANASLCLFIVCNTASIQLLPTTVAALRSATGSQDPFQILPAVWVTSFSALSVGIILCKFWEKRWKE